MNRTVLIFVLCVLGIYADYDSYEYYHGIFAKGHSFFVEFNRISLITVWSNMGIWNAGVGTTQNGGIHPLMIAVSPSYIYSFTYTLPHTFRLFLFQFESSKVIVRDLRFIYCIYNYRYLQMQYK